MPIKALALELYKAQQQVHTLQDRIATAAPGDIDRLRLELRRAEAELDQLRRIMEGEKASSPLSRDAFRR